MDRKIYYNGIDFDYAEAAKGGNYDVCNECDLVCDMYEELTVEEKKNGFKWGEWFLIAE